MRQSGFRPSVSVVSPASWVDRAEVEAGLSILREAGFDYKLGNAVFDRHGHTAGTAADRANDLQQAYLDGDTDAIWCTRGGSSSCQILPLIDWARLRAARPKPLIGYSDITSLHLAWHTELHTTSLHAPMIVELSDRITKSSRDAVLAAVRRFPAVQSVEGLESKTVVGGCTEGIVVGGCLTLIRASIGTPYQPNLRGKILLLEDIDSAPHQVERDLWQLQESGLLDGVAAFVIGEATGANDSETLPMSEIWAAALAKFGKPMVTGFPFGHIRDNTPVRLGAQARFDADSKRLAFVSE